MHAQTRQHQSTNTHSQAGRLAALLACVGCTGFAMLIWYKLRVVTNVPRAVYAEPEVSTHPESSAEAQDQQHEHGPNTDHAREQD